MIELTGMYQGDLWYFFTNYGDVIAHQWFYFIEYPVGYIIIQKIMYFLTTLFFHTFTYEHSIYAHALIMIPLMVLNVLVIDKIANIIGKNRKMSWAYIGLSPTFLIAASTNYDIFPVSCLMTAILFLMNKKYSTSFLLLGLGTVIKIFPGFILPIFILYVLSQKVPLASVVRYCLIFCSAIIILNLPFIVGNFEQWSFPYVWQSGNPQRLDPNTIMFYLSQIGLERFANFILGGFLIISWLVAWKFYQAKTFTNRNFLYCCLLTTFTAVFANHVNTPQYLLWFLPFIAILQIPLFFFWWPFDLINSLVLYSYFKLVSTLQTLQLFIFSTIILYFSGLYIYLLLHLKHSHEEN